jgi:hypothetical protein
MVANILTGSSQYFCKCDRNLGCRCLYNGLPKIWMDHCVLNLYLFVYALWGAAGEVIACHCY